LQQNASVDSTGGYSYKNCKCDQSLFHKYFRNQVTWSFGLFEFSFIFPLNKYGEECVRFYLICVLYRCCGRKRILIFYSLKFRTPLLIFSSFFLMTCAEMVPALIEGPTRSPIGCNIRLYTYQVTQTDPKGFTCTDRVMVKGCWGRCDSKEISDWKFPFKKSFHPVCVHKGLTKVVVELTECEPEAGPEARRYEYMEPQSCQCHICSSLTTSCESPRALHKGQVTRLIGSSMDEFEMFADEK
jgi:hypothetical protein